MCTVLVVAMVLRLTLAISGGGWPYFAAAGLVTGAAYQLRPNFVLFPLFIAASTC